MTNLPIIDNPFNSNVEDIPTVFTAGSIAFSDGTNLTEDNANLFWDDSNNRLGIGTSNPGTTLDVVGTVEFNNGNIRFKNSASSPTIFLDNSNANTCKLHTTRGSNRLSIDIRNEADNAWDNSATFRAAFVQFRNVVGVPTANKFSIGLDSNYAPDEAGIWFFDESHASYPGNVRIAHGSDVPVGDLSSKFEVSYIHADGTNDINLVSDSGGNLGVGATTFGTNAAGTIAFANGTAPTGNVANQHAYYSADQAAGNAAPHFRTEAGDVILLYKQSHITDAPGDTTANNATTINAILVALENTGLLAAA